MTRRRVAGATHSDRDRRRQPARRDGEEAGGWSVHRLTTSCWRVTASPVKSEFLFSFYRLSIGVPPHGQLQYIELQLSVIELL